MFQTIALLTGVLSGLIVGQLLRTTEIIKYFPRQISGTIWDKIEKDLLDFNKTLITLCSSALVLSFTLIGFNKIKIDPVSLSTAWISLAISILFGALLLFLKFLYRLSEQIVKKNTEKGEYGKDKPLKSHKELMFYFKSRTLIYWFAIFELSFFVVGLIMLTTVAISSLFATGK
jgi:hypothetical protein